MSTACALLLGSATLVLGDIIKRFFKVSFEAKREWWISRGTVLVISIITYIMAVYVTDILKTLLAGLTLNTAYAVITLMTLFLPGLCRRGSAAWTLGASMVSLGAWYVLPPSWQQALHNPIYLVLPATLLAFFLVTLLDRRPAKLLPVMDKPESGM